MKKIILAAALISIFNLQFTLCHAQSGNDPVLMEVAGKQIRQSEFMAEFLPTVDKDVVGKQEKHQALVDYVNLFANFRAKVADAKAMGMDTAASLERELKGYRNELAAPYLIDSNTLVSLINEAYGRNRYQLHAAHILVRVAPDALPADTMKALQHITELRNRIVNGEDFFAVSVEEMTEQVKDQPNRRVRPNEGDLGYFTAFDMVYPFENAAYGLNVGEVSQPVRTVYGYHIVYLIDKVEWYGKAKIAHIWYRDGEHPTINGTIDTVYKRLTEGVSFTQLARQSDDRQSADNGGELNEVPLGQLLPEYVNAFKDLKAGEFSKPFHTQYGWHIVKLLKRDTLPPLEKMMPYYKQRMARDQRGGASRKVFATHCRERFGAVDYTVTPQPQPKGRKRSKAPAPMMASLDQLIAQVNDTVFICKWNVSRAIDSLTDMRPLCKVNGKVYNAIDLAQYIGSHQVPGPIEEHGYYVRKRYEAFIDSIAVSLADQRLEQDYPEFASVIDDYRRGLMIFNYNDKMVWSKAMQDTLGYEAFYARESKKKSLANPEDSIYFWNTRARVVAIDIQDSVCLAPEKAVKLMRKALKKNLTSAEMRDMLTKKLNKNYDSKKAIRLWVDLVEKGNQKLLKDGMWSREVYSYPVKKGYRVLVVQEILEPTLKSSTEARGYYLNAYQNDVEQQLNERLRKQYNVKINWNVIDKITY